ncbi:hypothetical protein ABW19_dt0201499 [Dactylella cylindrospora]|nr:hypothetical protein ABW19_dt0201499 [Dactylella cylindrospora]
MIKRTVPLSRLLTFFFFLFWAASASVHTPPMAFPSVAYSLTMAMPDHPHAKYIYVLQTLVEPPFKFFSPTKTKRKEKEAAPFFLSLTGVAILARNPPLVWGTWVVRVRLSFPCQTCNLN